MSKLFLYTLFCISTKCFPQSYGDSLNNVVKLYYDGDHVLSNSIVVLGNDTITHSLKRVDSLWFNLEIDTAYLDKIGRTAFLEVHGNSQHIVLMTYCRHFEQNEIQKTNRKILLYDNQAIHPFPDVEAQFNDSTETLHLFIEKNIIYTNEMRKVKKQVRVNIEATVERDGVLSSIQIFEGSDNHYNDEALRVVRLIQPFKPAEYCGRFVRTKIIIPVIFDPI